VTAIEWRPAAKESLLAIIDYISDDNPAAAQTLLDDIVRKVGSLPDNPLMHREGRVAGTRELVVRGNYIVVYASPGDSIVIVQVLHAAQQWP